MKKIIKPIVAIVAIAVFVILKITLSQNKTDMKIYESATVHFEYSTSDIDVDLSDEDFSLIKDAFQNKKLYNDNPSCGFSEDICIVLQGAEQHLCPARDGCPVIYWKEKNKYFRITDDECKNMQEILLKYGMEFPCL